MGKRSDIQFTQFSRRKCLMRSGLITIFLIATALVIALPVIYLGRDEQKKNEEIEDNLQSKDESNTTMLPTPTPEQEFYLRLDNISCFTADKLEVKVTFELQYFPSDAQLTELNQTFGTQYETVLHASAVDSLRSVTTTFRVAELFQKDLSTRFAICDSITQRLEGLCCANLTHCKEFDYELLISDDFASFADTRLRDCANTMCGLDQVGNLLLMTRDYRDRLALGYPLSTRVHNVFQRYHVFQDIDVLITSLTSRINTAKGVNTASIDSLRSDVLNMTELILDHLHSKSLETTGMLDTADQKVLYAYTQLSTIFQEPDVIEDGKDLPLLVHTVETDQWLEEAQRHNTSSTPWILHHSSINASSIVIMVQDMVLINVTSATDAILGLMAAYYVSSVPYPRQRYGTFLFIESEVLHYIIRDEDIQQLQRLKDMFYV